METLNIALCGDHSGKSTIISSFLKYFIKDSTTSIAKKIESHSFLYNNKKLFYLTIYDNDTPFHSSTPKTTKRNCMLLDDPIFYSVFLALISFISYAVIFFIEYRNSFYYIYNIYFILATIPSCLISPLIIHFIKLKYSLLLSSLIFIVTLALFKSSNIGLNFLLHCLGSFSSSLSTICILSLLVVVNWESKYTNIMFGLFYLVVNGFQTSESYINFYPSRIYIFIILAIVAFILSLVLAQPDTCNNESFSNKAKFRRSIQHIVSKKSHFYLLVPILLLLGFSPLLISPFFCTVCVIPIAFLMEKIGRLKTFIVLSVFAVISVIFGFIIIYSHGISYTGPTSMYGYQSQFIYYGCLISYSTFITGTIMILTSMLCTAHIVLKENIVLVISAYQLIQSIGALLGFLIISHISPWLYWYISVSLFIFGCLFLALFLKVKSQNI